MILKPCTEVYINIQHKKLQERFINLANKRFDITDSIEDADIIISNKESNLKKLQIIVDNSNNFKKSTDSIVYFQPFLYNKQGNIDDCANSLFWMCVYKAWHSNAPLKIENTILLLC